MESIQPPCQPVGKEQRHPVEDAFAVWTWQCGLVTCAFQADGTSNVTSGVSAPEDRKAHCRGPCA